jgi:ParB family chromosome partitioning protein
MSTTTQQYEVGTIVHVAPDSLLMERNIREAKPDKAMIQSVREVGVLEPITAVLTDKGELLVRYGHRRTLAGIEAKTPTVPVYVSGNDDTATEAEVHRIIAQRDENTHRAGLNTAEEVGVVEQLTLLGLSAAQVAKKARIKRSDVDTALAVSTSEIARKATERYENLTLDQAAVVADFETDTETVKALVVAAHEGRFDHVAQRARDDRADAQAKAAVIAAMEAEGVRVVEAGGTVKRLSWLKATADSADTLSPADHTECPGHVAYLANAWVRVDSTGAAVEEPEEPENDDAGDDAWDAYEDQCQKWRSHRQVQRPTAVYGCEDPAKHGHVDIYASTGAPSKPKAADLSEKEREQAKAARNLVIENNKAWTAAETVRREWLATYAAIKTPPKGTGAFLAAALCKDSSVAGSVGGNSLASQWLGVKHTGYGWADLSPAKTATENRALVVVLMQILGGYEANLTKDSWRGDGTHSAVGRYLRFIETCGYTLSDVEKYAISKKTA